MKSMTGYGKGIAETNERKVTIEMKAVNHRYLDLLFKLPRGFNFLEECMRKQIKDTISRGHIDIYMSYEDNREGKSSIKVDTVAAKQYLDIGRKLQEIGFQNDITASQVLKMPEVLITKGEQDDEEIIKKLVIEALNEALKALIEMREIEGEEMRKEIYQRFIVSEKLLSDIKQKAPSVSIEYSQKIKERVTEYLNGLEIDETRLLNEVAYFADKANIDEEITRMNSHVIQGKRIIEENGLKGRKLDFLVQEMNREVNTIGSKSNDIIVTQKMLELKGEIEKIREQVQNIE